MKRRWSKIREWYLETGGTCISASASCNASALDTRSISHVEEAPLHHQPLHHRGPPIVHHQPLHHQAARVHISPPSQICTLAVSVGHNVSWSLGPLGPWAPRPSVPVILFLDPSFFYPQGQRQSKKTQAKAKTSRHKRKQNQAGGSKSRSKHKQRKGAQAKTKARGHTQTKTHRSKHKQTHREKQGSTGKTKAPKH
jgi:hypothetical protein